MNINEFKFLFNNIKNKFEEIENKFEEIENKLNTINYKKIEKKRRINIFIKKLNLNLENIEKIFDNLNLELYKICNDLDIINLDENMINEINEYYINDKVYKKFLIPMLIYKNSLINNNE
jgi:hypothetical protein